MVLALSAVGWVLIVAGVLFLWGVWTFNAFVRLGNRTRDAFSGIDVQLKRRHDLVPNLVKVVQAYARHEQETLEAVVEARGEAEAASRLGDRERSESGLDRSLDRLIALVEQYPDLKADGNFRKLHGDLVDIEDRRYYNGTVRDYNTRLQQFPANVLAGIFGRQPREFFQLEADTERRPPRVSLVTDES